MTSDLGPTMPTAGKKSLSATSRLRRVTGSLGSKLAGNLNSKLTGGRVDAAAPAGIVAGAEPYYAGDGPHAVLFCHGFTGSPRSMRPWAQHLEKDGFRVAVPRLPGHGTTWQEMNTTEWTDWYAVVEREFVRLRSECDQVFVAGLSMGGCLALRLAEQHGDEVKGIAVVNPAVMSTNPQLKAVPVLRHILPSLDGIASDIAMPQVKEGGYDRTPLNALHSMMQMWPEVHAGLAAIDQPLVLYRSRIDHVVDPSSGQAIMAGISSTDKTEIVLERSYHVATMDHDAETIFTGSSAFFSRVLAG